MFDNFEGRWLEILGSGIFGQGGEGGGGGACMGNAAGSVKEMFTPVAGQIGGAGGTRFSARLCMRRGDS